MPLFRLFATFPLRRCAVSAASSNSALSVCAFCSHFLLSPSVRTHVNFLPLFRLFATFPLHSCTLSAATYRSALSVRSFCSRSRKVSVVFSRVLDRFFFTSLYTFCRYSAFSRLFLYTAAQFLPFFRFFATFPLRDCTVSAVLPIPHLLSLPFIHNAKNLFTHE